MSYFVFKKILEEEEWYSVIAMGGGYILTIITLHVGQASWRREFTNNHSFSAKICEPTDKKERRKEIRKHLILPTDTLHVETEAAEFCRRTSVRVALLMR